MIFEYTGWDDYVDLKRTDEQYQQIKKEWKGAVNDYFGITIPPEDERTPTVAHMKQIEFQVSKLRNDIYTIHTRINDIQNTPPKIKQTVNEIKEKNVIGRIEALEEWRNNLGEIEPFHYSVIDKVKELETNYEHLKIRDNVLRDDIDKIRYRNQLVEEDIIKDKKIIDKKVWQEIKNIVSCREYWAGEFGRAVQHSLIQQIKKVDPEWEPDK